ncbi:TonB-dependent receptor [Neiella sp. HB171785]|uniref:TonB-dependent receptor n=1 Tax=Neiella litorisoli TaxID=2771431 RepID=A0A8J6QVN5_9GAMM|nr:TonB-dependent receptor [Neiella litorisoli]MBD1390733.1 TonB-dependent receptor [Neiella litorisoli]
MLNQRFHRCAIAVAVSSFFAVHSASAAEQQQQQQQDQQQSVERIAVWSTAVSSSSMYMSAETIADKQADHISDLLRTIPGVDVGGAHSLNQRITIRSMDDKDLDISIDGAKQNTYMYHHMGNLQIHADILKSVDIDVGTNSVINSGLGGSVRFETKQARELLRPDQTIGGRIQVTAGDNSGENYSASGYGLLGEDFDFLAYYNYVDRDNYEVGGGKIKNGSGEVIEGTDGKVRGLEGEVDDLLLKLGWNLTGNQRLQLSYESYKDEGDYSYRPDMGLATDIAITESLQIPLLWPTEFTRDTVTLNYELLTDSTLLKAAVYTNSSELWRDETGYGQNPAYAAWAAIVTGEAKNSGINMLAETTVDDADSHEITWGFDYVKHDTDYKTKSDAGQLTSGEDASNLAIFAQDRIRFNDQFSITPGFRYDKYDIDSAVIDDSFSNTAFALAAEYQPVDNLVIKLSGTQLFKGPEISEVFVGAGLDEVPNPDIKEETGVNYEAAFAYRADLNSAGTLSVGGTVFKTEIDGYIYDYATPPEGVRARYWKDNIGDMELDGFEAYSNYSIGEFDAGITFSRAESDLSAFAGYEQYDGARLDREQGDTISANAGYFFAAIDLSVFWEVLHVDDVDAGLDLDGASLDNSKDGYTVHNISARWEPANITGLTVIAGVDNLFDEFYASQSSRTGTSFHPRFGELYLQDYEPGRNIKATVAYQF